jgi:hypothetical protein
MMTTMTTKNLLAAVCNFVLLLAMAEAARNIRRSDMLKVDDLNKMDRHALLSNAIKIDKRLYHRLLDDAEGNAEEDPEDDNAENEDNPEEDNPEEENDVEDEQDENKEEEDQRDDAEEDADQEAVDQEEEAGEQEQDAAGEEQDAAGEEQDAAGEEQDAAEENVEEEQVPVLQLTFLKCGA